MLTPIIFVACSKVILDQNNNATLVEILQNLSVPIPENVVLPPNAAAPREWSVFTMWKIDSTDVGKPYVQYVRMSWPDKTEFQTGKLPLQITSGKGVHQATVNVIGFPVGQEGPITIETWLELDGKRIGDEHTYTISVEHQKAPATPK
jgi:hypothetical protein